MLKETIKYTDYNGVPREEDFYFNLTEAEVTEMELSEVGGMSALMQRIINTDDRPALIKIFKEIICKSYGEKSADGKRFMKFDENDRPLVNNFKQSEAYSVLFMKLSTDADAAARFVQGILPANMNQKSEPALIK